MFSSSSKPATVGVCVVVVWAEKKTFIASYNCLLFRTIKLFYAKAVREIGCVLCRCSAFIYTVKEDLK